VSTLAALRDDAGCRVLVLGGRGPSFCAGADIGAMKASANASYEDNLAEARRLAAMFAALAEFPKPVLARVHGGVYGGGVGLCCASDIVVASDDARFGLTEVRLGILPGLISPYVIRRLGDRTARELMLTGERFDAARALAAGMVNHVVPAAELDARVAERAGELLKGGPQAQARVKQLFERWGELGWAEYRALLPETLAGVRGGDEAKDGLAAFLEKRKPGWLG
jgi:methylglutaconyl-CoA hydratase